MAQTPWAVQSKLDLTILSVSSKCIVKSSSVVKTSRRQNESKGHFSHLFIEETLAQKWLQKTYLLKKHQSLILALVREEASVKEFCDALLNWSRT